MTLLHQREHQEPDVAPELQLAEPGPRRSASRTVWQGVLWTVDRTLRVLGAVALLAIAVVVAVTPYRLTDSQEITALKVFVVIVAAFLPAYLFIRFLSFRANALWDEYVLNLHRLKIDDAAHLPVPPRSSIYYETWAAAGGNDHVLDEPTIYQEKFEAYFGKIVTYEMAHRRPPSPADKPAERRAERRAQIGGLFPVMLVTAMAAAGWSVIVRDGNFLSRPTGGLDEALRFGFLGAYTFILQLLLRRFFQSDLKASAYTAGAVRIISVLTLVGALHWMWADQFAPATQAALAFTVGFFPLVGMQALEKTAKTALRIVVPSLRTEYPLSDLDGLNIWYEARLLEEGIEDMQNLATANLVEVILHTRVPVGRLVDWIDQAHLYLHLEPPKRRFRKKGGDSRDRLRRLGIRAASDLQIAFARYDDSIRDCRKWIGEKENEELRRGLRWALNSPEERGDDHPSVTQSILKTFENDPNLIHVNAWKSNWAEEHEGIHANRRAHSTS